LAPDTDFLIIGAVAALVTFLATFVVRRLAVRFAFVVLPDARRVHEKPTPTVGGAAMFVGFLAAMAVASQIPRFSQVFRGNSEPLGLVLGAAVIFAVGLHDDLREMSPPAKMSGQVLAGTVLYLFGVTMFYVRLPLVGTTLLLSPQLAPVFTVLWVVGIANAVNFIDGLDGLATGIIAIASISFFLYSHELLAGTGPLVNSGPVVAVIIFGICIGFLPHNFHPARIFMGDAGAMLLGLLMAGSTMSVVGQTSQTTSGRTFFTFAPIVIPFFILGIPLVDTAFAVIRRARRGINPAVADKNHLHHRLMRLGHGQRRSVLILWAWTALLSSLVLYPSLTDRNRFLVPVAATALAVILVTIFARGGRRAAADALPAVSASPDEATNPIFPQMAASGLAPAQAQRPRAQAPPSRAGATPPRASGPPRAAGIARVPPRTGVVPPRAAAAAAPRTASTAPRTASTAPRAAAVPPRAAAVPPRAAAVPPRAAAVPPRTASTPPGTAAAPRTSTPPRVAAPRRAASTPPRADRPRAPGASSPRATSAPASGGLRSPGVAGGNEGAPEGPAGPRRG
jgi:UDP-GlcNAc:undecaprenyl-phosphate GlcNAc-1-phosphate transferase